MKCPKCGYLGFESGDRAGIAVTIFRCVGTSDPRTSRSISRPMSPGRRSISIASRRSQTDAAGDLPLFAPRLPTSTSRPRSQAHAPAAASVADDDAPLITAPARPRAPLGVSRATAEIPRARTRPTRPPRTKRRSSKRRARSSARRSTAPARARGRRAAAPLEPHHGRACRCRSSLRPRRRGAVFHAASLRPDACQGFGASACFR